MSRHQEGSLARPQETARWPAPGPLHSHSIINGTRKPLSRMEVFSTRTNFTVRLTVNSICYPKTAFSIYRHVSRWIDALKRSAFRIVRDLSASIAGGAFPAMQVFRIYRRLSIGAFFRPLTRVKPPLAYSPASMCRRLVPGRFCPRLDLRQGPCESCLRKLCVVVGL